jgi:hypothetical protein
MSRKSTWVRAEGQATSVGNSSNKVTVSLTVPHRGLIRRIRCRDDGTGTGTPTVEAQINETSAAGTGTDIVLLYGATANPGIDSEEEIFYQVSESGVASRVGTLYVTVWTGNAATDHVIDVVLAIEVIH